MSAPNISQSSSEAPNQAGGRWIALKRNQIIELAVLASLSALLLLYLLLRNAASFSYTLPKFAAVSPADVQSIRWNLKGQSGGESGQLLRKEGEQWHIGEQKYPAKQGFVDTLLQQLSEPSLQDLVSKSGNLLTFALDDERAYELEALDADGNSLRRFYVGKSSSSGRYSYVRLNEDDLRVFTLSANLSSVLQKSVDELRDRLVLNFSSEDIEKLQILADEKIVSVEKTDDKWQVPDDVTWGEEQIQSLINRFASMNAQDFIANYPATDAEYEVKFVAVGGASYTVTIAAAPLDDTLDDNGYPAKSSSYGFPFTLNQYTVESMLKDFGFIEEDEENPS